jgi:hypothetical protein
MGPPPSPLRQDAVGAAVATAFHTPVRAPVPSTPSAPCKGPGDEEAADVCNRRECPCAPTVFLDLWRALRNDVDDRVLLAMVGSGPAADDCAALGNAYKAWVQLVHQGRAECEMARLVAVAQEWTGKTFHDVQPLMDWVGEGAPLVPGALASEALLGLKAAVTEALAQYMRAVAVVSHGGAHAEIPPRVSVVQAVGRALVYGGASGWWCGVDAPADRHGALATWQAGVDKTRALTVSDLARMLDALHKAGCGPAPSAPSSCDALLTAMTKWADTVTILLPALQAVADAAGLWDQVVRVYMRTLCFQDV